MHFLEADLHIKTNRALCCAAWLAAYGFYVILLFVSKTKYMTLGPKFFCCKKMPVTQRKQQLNQYILAGFATLFEILLLTVSTTKSANIY